MSPGLDSKGRDGIEKEASEALPHPHSRLWQIVSAVWGMIKTKN